MQWLRRTRRAYIGLVDADKLSTWPVAVIVIQNYTEHSEAGNSFDVRSFIGHGGGGWTDFPRLPRAVVIISFDFAVQFQVVCGCPLVYVCYFNFSQTWYSVSSWYKRERRRLTTTCGDMCRSSAYLKTRFAGVTGCKYKLLCPRGTQTCALAVANIKVNGNTARR